MRRIFLLISSILLGAAFLVLCPRFISAVNKQTQEVNCLLQGSSTLHNGKVQRFSDNGDGTVSDACTGLTWEKTTSGDNLTWDQGNTHCSNLTLANQTGWRMPGVQELASIIDYASPNLAANPVFVFANDVAPYALYVWTSTEDVNDTTKAWEIEFTHAATNPLVKTSEIQVRCVRN